MAFTPAVTANRLTKTFTAGTGRVQVLRGITTAIPAAIDLRQALALCAVALAGLMAAITIPAMTALRGDARQLLAPT